MTRHTLLRKAIIFGAPISYFVIGMVHPLEMNVGDDPTLYIAIHVVQLFSIWGMAIMLLSLTEGIEGRTAHFARASVLPYAIAYGAFDGMAGVGIGLLVREANGMSPSDQAAVQGLLAGDSAGLVDMAMYLASSLTWLCASMTAIVSLKGRAPGGALVLLVAGAAVFAVAHPFPPGPIGMTLFLAGLAWLHFAAAPVSQMATVQPAPTAERRTA